MLGNLLRNFLSSRNAQPDAVVVPAPADGAARLYKAALEAWRAGRPGEAVAGCKEALELDPSFAPAHVLLANIDLPGENYLEVLGRIQAHVRPRSYVEIGVARGESIRLVDPATRAIGVDPEPNIQFELPPNVAIVAETSDEFFAKHDVSTELGNVPIDLAFIDGMHQFEFALRDFVNIEALCTPDSTILIHDVYPLDERTAARERVTDFWSGDIWRLILLLRAHRPDLAVHTIATQPTGLAIVRKLDPQSRYLRANLDRLIDEYRAVEFSVLDGCKAERLALFPNDWTRIKALLDAGAPRVAEA